MSELVAGFVVGFIISMAVWSDRLYIVEDFDANNCVRNPKTILMLEKLRIEKKLEKK